jgi:predicted transcriptional regulator
MNFELSEKTCERLKALAELRETTKTMLIEQLVEQEAQRVGIEVESEHGSTLISQRDPGDEA